MFYLMRHTYTQSPLNIDELEGPEKANINTRSLENFMNSIGLPMYTTELRQRGYDEFSQLLQLNERTLQNLSIQDAHRKLLLEYVRKA